MIDKKAKEAYESIKAPDELYARVFNGRKHEKKGIFSYKNLRILSTAAALFIVLSVAMVFTSIQNSPSVYLEMNGSAVGSSKTAVVFGYQSVDAMAPRVLSLEEFPVYFEPDVQDGAQISVSAGEVSTCNAKTLSETESGTEVKYEKGMLIKWVLDNVEGQAEMKITAGKKTVIYICEESAPGEWFIYKK